MRTSARAPAPAAAPPSSSKVALTKLQDEIQIQEAEKLFAATRKVRDWIKGTQCEKKIEYEEMQMWLEGVVHEIGTTASGRLFMEQLEA